MGFRKIAMTFLKLEITSRRRNSIKRFWRRERLRWICEIFMRAASGAFKEELRMALEALKGKEKQKVLLYCTGGIRCEKASAYLKHHGFKYVNQLRGGIISYAHEIRQKGLDSLFKGKNYVF